jgi:prepilin-type N-terminal cleavage/methylation domain-containing protein
MQKKGFTLVEIMIVVVIIGLLAMLAIPAFKHVRESAQETTVTNNLRQIANAADEYFTKNGDAASVAFNVLVDTNNGYIKTLQSVAGENYQSVFPINVGYTQISINVPRLNKDVAYNQ